MKMLRLGVAIAAIPFANAALAAPPTASGHWEWRVPPGFGANKAPLPPRQVWIGDPSAGENPCDCAMMDRGSGDCLRSPTTLTAKP